jgi:hypothetical protein
MTIVYILTNEAMPGVIKIGVTDNLDRRVKELDGTSTPLPFECYYAVEVEDAYSIEKKIHHGLDDKRVRNNREFFYSSPEQAKSLLQIAELMGGKEVTPKGEIVESVQDSDALKKAKKRSVRIEYFTLLNIAPGETLTFAKDSSITCTVHDNRKIKFRDEVTTLSASALMLLNEMGYSLTAVQGANSWYYRGKSLVDLLYEHEA